MDQTVINIIMAISLFVGGVILSAIGWFANSIWSKQQEHDRRFTSLEVKLAGEYVSNSELTIISNELKTYVTSAVGPLHTELVYIRNRVDNLPQRRASDPHV